MSSQIENPTNLEEFKSKVETLFDQGHESYFIPRGFSIDKLNVIKLEKSGESHIVFYLTNNNWSFDYINNDELDQWFEMFKEKVFVNNYDKRVDVGITCVDVFNYLRS